MAAMPFSQYLADVQLNWLRGTSYASAPSTNLYISLHSADPGINGLNSDVTVTLAGSRGTLPIANLTAPAASPSGGRQVSNSASVSLSNSAQGAATVTYYGIWDAASGGNFLTYGLLTQPVNVLVGDIIEFPVGQLVIRGI